LYVLSDEEFFKVGDNTTFAEDMELQGKIGGHVTTESDAFLEVHVLRKICTGEKSRIWPIYLIFRGL